MSEQSDRERAEKLAQEKERARNEARAKLEQEKAEHAQKEANQLALDRQKTEELFQYCKQQYAGFRLNPTGHEVSLETASRSRLQDIEPDRVDYVAFSITHWGDETGHFQGHIPILHARCRNNQYELVLSDGKRVTVKTLDQAKDRIVHALSDLGREEVSRLFANVRRKLGR